MAGTEDSKTHSLTTGKSEIEKIEEGAGISLESSRFTRKKIQTKKHSSATPRTEQKQTYGGVQDESGHSAGTYFKKGRSLHQGKGEASHEFRKMNQASSSRYSLKRRDKFKGLSGNSQSEKGKCLKKESHSRNVVDTRRYKTDRDKKINIQDSKQDKQRWGGMKNKQKHVAKLANKCISEKESSSSWNNTLKENKGSIHHTKYTAEEKKKTKEARKEDEGSGGHKETSGVTLDQTASSSTGVRQIPGFYYDHEKKRYFRILPGHFHSNTWITSETVKEKTDEETRRKLFKQENQPKTKNRKSTSAVSILQSSQRGELNTEQHFRSSIECRVRAMSLIRWDDFESKSDYVFPGIMFHTKFLQLDRSQCKLLVVQESEQLRRILLASVSAAKKGSLHTLQISKWQDIQAMKLIQSQISSVSLVNISQQDSSPAGNLYALFSWSGGISNGVQLVRCPSSDDFVGSRTSYSLHTREMIPSCSWCSNPQYPAYVCIGFCDRAEVIDTLSTSRQILNTRKSAVYSQVFAREQPLIYLGTKRGDIMTYDLRIHPTSFLLSFEESSNHLSSVYNGKGVCSLRLLKNESYLLAGSFNGLIKLWDLRKRAVVKEIHGHQNNYKQVPVEIDDSENFVYAGGQDNVTRIWSLKDCAHLRTIPYPIPWKSIPPASAMSLDWGGKGLPGLITAGALSMLHWYKF